MLKSGRSPEQHQNDFDRPSFSSDAMLLYLKTVPNTISDYIAYCQNLVDNFPTKRFVACNKDVNLIDNLSDLEFYKFMYLLPLSGWL